MNIRSMSHDVKNAIQRAKNKISSLESELCLRENISENDEERNLLTWKLKQELKDSLVDMYKANPKVNEELKQRLPSPVKRHCSETTPQLGFSSTDISPRALEADLIKGLRLSRPEEDPETGPLPPPPPPPPILYRSMEEGRISPQRPLAQQGLDGEELDNTPMSRPYCSTPQPPSPRRITDEDHGNSKVNRDTKRQVPVLDKEKNIAFLLKELDSLRDLNRKLQDKLAIKEKELETMRLDNQLQETKLEARACEKAAALVEEIYKAQRERDQAVMARLRLANEERDEALLRAKKIQEAVLELENINPEESDTDLEELLNRVSSADSALIIERNGMAIMEQIQRARERRSKITSEEMRVVLDQRDNALTRCQRLEHELLQITNLSQTRHTTTPDNQEKIQLELEAVQRERDTAVELSNKLEEELQVLRRYHSAQRSQMVESGRKEPPGTPSGTWAKDSPAASSHILQNHLQQLTSELQNTQSQLRLARDSEREAIERVHKLERLVEVLRKKVGTGSVRTVI